MTARGALINSRHYMTRANQVDWYSRRGEVVRAGQTYIYIKWDGRTSVDYQEVCLVELAEE